MWIRTMRSSAMVLVIAAVLGSACRVWAMGEILGQSKEELKLKYVVAVEEHSFDGEPTGRVTVVFTLADEGRLKPLDEVQLVIPAREKNKDGSNWMDLVVSIDMRKDAGGKSVGRVHILKEWAERAADSTQHAHNGRQERPTDAAAPRHSDCEVYEKRCCGAGCESGTGPCGTAGRRIQESVSRRPPDS